MPRNFQFGSFRYIALVSVYPLLFEIIRPDIITSVTWTSGCVKYSSLINLSELYNSCEGEYYHRLILQMGKMRLARVISLLRSHN